MTPQEGLQELIDIIRFDLRPPMYEETVEISKRARMYHAKDSEAQRERLERIRLSETQEQKDQRVRLTNAITSVALGPVYSYAEEVWRTDGVTSDVGADGVPEQIVNRINEHHERFYGSESLDRYCFSAALMYTKVDPNAWTVFESKFNSNQQGATVIDDLYPVEVMSDEVRGYGLDETGTPIYLAFEFKRTVYDPNNRSSKRELSDFFLYGVGFSIHFVEVDPIFTDGKDYQAISYDPIQVPDTTRMFYARTATNTTQEVPAIRWSAYLSHDYDRKIGETLVATAIPLLNQVINDNSLLQLIKYLHAHPEKHQYVRRCNHQDENGLGCISGYYGGGYDPEKRCRQCKGTGKLISSSEQDIVTLAWPARPEDLVDLAKITHYVERPIEILIQFREIVSEAQGAIMAAVYNQQTINPEVMTQTRTATGERIEYDKIYNKLSPFAEIIALAWEKGVRCAYQYYGYTKTTANKTFPNDFKMKDIATLLEERKAAIDAKAPYAVISSLDADILKKQHRNNPHYATEVMDFERWRPWKDKTAEEVALIIQNRDTTDPDRVLWENWTQIVDLVRIESATSFVNIPPDQQRTILYEYANQFAPDIVYAQLPDPFAGAFQMTDEDEQ